MSLACQKQYTLNVSNIPKPTLYWTMDEAVAGDRVDSIHSLHLAGGLFTPPDPVAGVISNGCVFRGDSFPPMNHPTALSVVSSAFLGYASGGISTTFWIKVNATNPTVVEVWEFVDPSGAALLIFNFKYDSTIAGGSVVLTINTNNFAQNTTVVVGAAPLGVWVFVAATYDPLTLTVKTSLNGGSQTSTVLPSLIPAYTPGELLTNQTSLNTGEFSLDELGIWFGAVLTAANLSTLYNGGTASRPPFS